MRWPLPFRVGYHIQSGGRRPMDSLTEAREGQEGDGQARENPDETAQARRQQNVSLRSTNESPCDSDRAFEQDGFIASLTLFFMAVGLSFGLCVARWIAVHQTVRVKDVHVDIMVITFMLGACICVWILLSKRKQPFIWNYVLVKNVETPLEAIQVQTIIDRIQASIHSSIPLFGLVIFFTAGLFLDILRIISHGDCMAQFYTCDILFPYIASIVFHLMRIIFQSSLIVFALAFYKQTFQRSCTTRYILLALLAAVFVVWLESIFIFSRKALPVGYRFDFPQCVNHTNTTSEVNTSKPDRLLLCVNHSTNLYKLYDQFSPYLYPLHIEYALIVSEIISHMYCSTIGPALEKKEGHPSSSSLRVLDDSAEDHPSGTPCDTSQNSPGSDDHLHLLNPTGFDDLSLQVRRAFHCKIPFSLSIGLVVNILMIIFASLIRLDVAHAEEGDHSNTWHLIYESYKVVYFALLSIACIVGFIHSKGAISKFTDYTGLELLVIGSCTSYFILVTFDMISTVSYLAGTEYDQTKNASDLLAHIIGFRESSTRPSFPTKFVSMTLLRGLVNIVQFFLQITFMMHVTRIIPRGELSKRILKEVALILAISNLALWAVDSFIEVQETFPISAFYYGHMFWELVSYILMPFSMFYRFNCLLIFLSVHLKL